MAIFNSYVKLPEGIIHRKTFQVISMWPERGDRHRHGPLGAVPPQPVGRAGCGGRERTGTWGRRVAVGYERPGNPRGKFPVKYGQDGKITGKYRKHMGNHGKSLN